MPFQPYEIRRAQVIVTVSRPDSAGTPQDQTYTFDGHRMRIQVRQGGSQFGNARVQVFGVPLDTMNQIARLWLEALTPQNTDSLTINVWTGEGFVPFFVGVITWSAVNAAGMPNVYLDIEANSSTVGANTVASPYANAGPVTLQAAIEQIAKAGGFTLDYAPSLGEFQMVQVRATGTPIQQITSIMNAYPELAWTVNLQKVVIRRADAPLTSDSVRIAADTGMIGYPVYSTSGITVATLFDSRIRPGLPLDVETEFDFVNRTVWVAAVLEHTLDVNVPGGKWETQIAANAYGPKGNNDGSQ